LFFLILSYNDKNLLIGVLYEGSSEIQTIIQAGYALGEREDRPLRCEMPSYNEEEWQADAYDRSFTHNS
jgi:glutaryl-CoA dehydrogenase (non-decarboxylating)